jgi:hypothetical protein
VIRQSHLDDIGKYSPMGRSGISLAMKYGARTVDF